jgi:dihydrolipoamide dehydrogenase
VARVHFQDATTLVSQQGEAVCAQSIVIATGSAPVVPPLLGSLGHALLTNENIFELPTLPGRLAVFGTGVLGMELAQALSRLGVHVKMFGVGGGVAGIHDTEIRDYANQTFNEEFYLDPDAQVRSVQPSGEGAEIQYLHKDGLWHTEHFDYVLAATGRAPSLHDLTLDTTGLALDKKGVPVFDRLTMQCGTTPIFMAGDASNAAPLLHEAADQGRTAGENAARYPDVRPHLHRTPLALVFTEPQLAFAGVNLEQLGQQYKDRYAVGCASFENQGRSRVMLRNKGLLKVYAEQGSGLFLGAEMFAPAAQHIGHLLAWAAQQRMTVSDMLTMPFYHPVVEEGLRTALRELEANVHHHQGSDAVAQQMRWGPGC